MKTTNTAELSKKQILVRYLFDSSGTIPVKVACYNTISRNATGYYRIFVPTDDGMITEITALVRDLLSLPKRRNSHEIRHEHGGMRLVNQLAIDLKKVYGMEFEVYEL